MTDTEKSDRGQEEMSRREARSERRLVIIARVMLVMGVAILFLIGGLIYVASLPREIVQIVEVDPEGKPLWYGKPGSYEIKDLWVATTLQWRWIYNSRRRGDEPKLLGEMRLQAEQMTTGEALKKLKDYHDGTNPLKVPELKQNPIRTDLHDFKIEKLNPTHYAINWREKWTPTFGQHSRWRWVRAQFTIEHRLQPGPFGMVQLKGYDANRSAIGVYVTDYTLNEGWED